MPTYIGFSTINADVPRTTNNLNRIQGTGSMLTPLSSGKKYRIVDEQLVIRDFINALNIPMGQKVGQPGYGTKLWDFVFEPNTQQMQKQLENEIRRVANADPRIQINYVTIFPSDNGVLLEVEMAVTPFNQALVLSVFFNQSNYRASIV